MKKLLLILLVIVVGFSFFCGTEFEKPLRERECTKENVYLALKQLNIKFVDIAFAQIMLESGNLKSKLSITNNNIIGMRYPRKRETTSLGSKNGYAKYLTWFDCIIDYMLYQKNVINGKDITRPQYLALLNKKYSESTDYKNRLIRIIKENKFFIKQQDSLISATSCEL